MSASPLRPIPLTVGSIPALENILGREQQVDRVLSLLEQRQSVLLTGDRRVGKTCVARLVEARLAADGRRHIRTSAERTDYPAFLGELARALAQTRRTEAAREELGRWEVTLSAGPVGLTRGAGSAPERGLDELVEAALPDEGDPPLVLIIDEVPMLALEMERTAPGSGRELLMTLRRLRQQHSSRLSMLLLGSIGFHHVVGSSPGAVNDVAHEPVGPLAEADALHLARCLLLGESVATTDPLGAALAIVEAAEAVPYYIQHLVKAVRDAPGTATTTADITRVAEQALGDPNDPWNLRHYRERIPAYYGPDRAELVETTLDLLATRGPLGIDELRRLLTATGITDIPSRRDLVRLVEDLERDHYLARHGTASDFRSQLVRGWWKQSLR